MSLQTLNSIIDVTFLSTILILFFIIFVLLIVDTARNIKPKNEENVIEIIKITLICLGITIVTMGMWVIFQ